MSYKRPTILLCESYPGLQEAFQLMSDRWASLRLAPTVEECLAALTQEEPDLLILDIDGQKADPLALLANLRSTYPDLKLLLVAAEFTYDFQVACVKLGQLSFLTKPFSVPAAVAKMKVLLGLAASSIHTRVVKIPLS
ncbi:MAG: response regulator [Candidatus Omnitrophota bacterium]|nr:response regulator [Candidatus Omnitrophota bacterium]